MNNNSSDSSEKPSRYVGEKHFVGSHLSDTDFAEIRDILFAGRGFDLDGYKDRCIKRRIALRIRTLGYGNASDYIRLLTLQEKEQGELLEAITIHVSQFFRNPTTFTVLEKTILPLLLKKRRGQVGGLRVWSVGCAGGEEPYSIALLCDELCGPEDQVSIIGSDVSADILKRAKAGLYEAHRLVEVPASVLHQYFTQEGLNYRLQSRICAKVRFIRHDILQDRHFPRADLILCRNMLIYFSRQEQERILRSLAATLAPEGLLVLGRAETLVNDCRELFTCVDPAERIYRKRNEATLVSNI
ncbi:CheR family methyltransferase [Geopsychrobacter electrodiphilus]|uniref:CheR family methyltransferase n=1 Tax=Geopsychrobacter electrodiphilus TaxID=225196 RepID=UPI000364F305|nr:protein-glutamate O-methyltransferase CheR [Geopsychrobacter electrodiphilus]